MGVGDSCRPGLTDCHYVTHNHGVMHSLSRTAVTLALAPWLVLSAGVAPEHIHEADAHHSEAVVHRHFEPHHHDAIEISHRHKGAEFSQCEERVIWLDDVGVQQSTYHLVTAQAVVAPHFATLPEPKGWVIASTLDAAP